MEHWLNVKELVGDLGNEQLTGYNYCDNCPESAAHFYAEYAFAGLKHTGVEHIPEMSPNKY